MNAVAKGLFDDLRRDGNFASKRTRYVVAVVLLLILTLGQPPSAASEGVQLDVLEVLPDAVLQEIDGLGRDADRLKKDLGFAQPVGDFLEIFIPASEQTLAFLGVIVVYSPATDHVLASLRVTGTSAPDGGMFTHVQVGEEMLTGYVPYGLNDISQGRGRALTPKSGVQGCGTACYVVVSLPCIVSLLTGAGLPFCAGWGGLGYGLVGTLYCEEACAAGGTGGGGAMDPGWGGCQGRCANSLEP